MNLQTCQEVSRIPMGQDSTVPGSPLLTQFPSLCGAGTQLHGPKGCCHSSAGPDPAPLASSLSWGREVERWLCIHRDALAALWWHRGGQSADGAGQAPSRPLLCFLLQGSGITFTTLPQHSEPQGLPRWDWPGRSTGTPISWLLFHGVHWESSTASHPSTGAGHCFFWY